MITPQLLHPKSIAVIGGSNDIRKPGGKILRNILDGGFAGSLTVVNPKEAEVQGIRSVPDVSALPPTDLAIIAIAAKYALPVVETLAREKGTRGFIIVSAGFSEESPEGKELERRIVAVIDEVGGSLIGPNCTGVCLPQHHSIFTEPIPKLDPHGVDFISGSGATACFILEAGIPKGLTFASIFTVGNSAQLGVEEILAHLDETFDPATSARVKLLYIETVSKPDKLLRHARSLIRKGCRIAAVKAGSSEAGSRAASSHTGALASSDVAVDALFRKAGIVRCYGREDLITVASIFMHPPLAGKNIAIITHAGGPAVMLTDALSNGGLAVPHISGPAAEDLLAKLYPGSSVANPIDFLATGTAEQLGAIIDAVDTQFDDIDAMVVIFGTPGLTPIFDVYDLLDEKMRTARKPIYPVLPSTLTARAEVEAFLAKGRINFPDEVTLGNALARISQTPPPPDEESMPAIDHATIRRVIEAEQEGYISPASIQQVLDAAGIPRAGEAVVTSVDDAVWEAKRLGFPLVMKVVGPVHKSDVGGVVLGVRDEDTVRAEFDRMIKIADTTAVLLQPMLSGIELFAGAKKEDAFGHLVLCGLGGIFIEVLKDVRAGLAPLSRAEARDMIRGLKGYKILQGVRGQAGVNADAFADVVLRLSALVQAAPEIIEMDLNPLLGTPDGVTAVDARIRIQR
ncbi:MAG: acetate--CoA ligase family protein [Bacteroidota bacterium]|jgi:acetyltransferase|nr:acetate--CoA ligase family protein [Bacteroidota bacterium]